MEFLHGRQKTYVIILENHPMLRKSPFRTHSLTWLPGKSWRWSENFGKLDSGLEERLKTDDVESGSWWSRWSEVSKVLRPRTSTMAACTWGERASLTCSGTSAQSSRSLHTTWRVLESLPLHITGGKKIILFSISLPPRFCVQQDHPDKASRLGFLLGNTGVYAGISDFPYCQLIGDSISCTYRCKSVLEA